MQQKQADIQTRVPDKNKSELKKKKCGGWETTANAKKIPGKAGKETRVSRRRGPDVLIFFSKQQKKNNHRRGTMVERVTINITCRQGKPS